MEKFNKIKERGLRIAATVSSHHTGAFAAQAAYFFVLSLIPIFMLLLTMVQFTPVTKADVMEAVLPVFPSTVSPMIESIVNQVYDFRYDHSFDNPCGFVVSGKRSTFCNIWIELHLSKHRDEKLFLPSRKSMYVYFFVPCGNHALIGAFRIR